LEGISIMPYGTVNADVIGTSVAGSNLGAGNASTMKNRIINGAMVIDQRNAGASTTPTTTGASVYNLDRWAAIISQASKFSVQQNAGSVTPPAGFTNYLGTTSLAATSLGAGDYFLLGQYIEGYNIADLGWGTANAKTVTLSFQVYSSLTGTFGGSILNNASTRSYPFTYTVSSANTWTPISITIAGDTGGAGTWLTTNGIGIKIFFGLGVGSTYSGAAGSWSGSTYLSATGATSVVGTNGATFYITGVQLEVGSSATGFEYRQYQQELALCQRYFQQIKTTSADSWIIIGATTSTTAGQLTYNYVVTPRTPATGITVSAAGDFGAVTPGNSNAPCTAITFNAGGSTNVQINFTCPAATFSATVPQTAYLYRVVSGGYIQFTGMEL
jgi:hypothetical protein